MSTNQQFSTSGTPPASVPARPSEATRMPTYTAAFAPAGFVAYAINNAGNVAGQSEAGAAIWSRTRVTTFLADGIARGINNRGDIVGQVFQDFNTVAFVRTRAGTRFIRLDRYEEYCWGSGINSAGQVIGNGNAAAGEGASGFVDHGGVTTLIDSFGGDWSYARSINSVGQVVGTGAYHDQTVGYNHHSAFVYKDGVLESLGTLGGLNSEAWDINDAGQIVGSAETQLVADGESSPVHVFLYEGGSMKDLGSLGSDYTTAYAINNAGVIVGQSGTAFLYMDGRMTDLNTLVSLPDGCTLVAAIGINGSGQILARALNADESEAWVRLTPRRADGR